MGGGGGRGGGDIEGLGSTFVRVSAFQFRLAAWVRLSPGART